MFTWWSSLMQRFGLLKSKRSSSSWVALDASDRLSFSFLPIRKRKSSRGSRVFLVLPDYFCNVLLFFQLSRFFIIYRNPSPSAPLKRCWTTVEGSTSHQGNPVQKSPPNLGHRGADFTPEGSLLPLTPEATKESTLLNEFDYGWIFSETFPTSQRHG